MSTLSTPKHRPLVDARIPMDQGLCKMSLILRNRTETYASVTLTFITSLSFPTFEISHLSHPESIPRKNFINISPRGARTSQASILMPDGSFFTSRLKHVIMVSMSHIECCGYGAHAGKGILPAGIYNVPARKWPRRATVLSSRTEELGGMDIRITMPCVR